MAVTVAYAVTASRPLPSFVIGELQVGLGAEGRGGDRKGSERNQNETGSPSASASKRLLRLTGSRLAHVVKWKPTDEALQILVVHGHESKKRPKDELVLTVVYTRVAKDLERRVRPAQEIEQEQGPR